MIPALFNVTHRVFAGAGSDAYGNPVESWSAGTAKKFVTFNTPRTSEPKLAGHDRDVVDLELIVKPDFGLVGSRDHMVIDGREYEVIGLPEDFTKNPWRGDFGCYTINLRVVNG